MTSALAKLDDKRARLAEKLLARARRGFVNAASAKIDALADALDDAPPAARGVILEAAGEIALRGARLRVAARRHFAAAQSWAEAGEDHRAAVALARCAHADVVAGELPAARKRASAMPSHSWAADARMALADGDPPRARNLLKVPRAQTGEAAGWEELLRLETFLAMNAVVGARESAEAAEALVGDRLGEAALRLRVLRARLAVTEVESLRGDPVDAALARLDDEVRGLTRYSAAFPLYDTWRVELEGELGLLRGQDATALFDEAQARAEALGAPFLRARLLARQADRYSALEERLAQPRAARARALLLDMGANDKLATVRSKVSEAPRASRMSIAMRLEQDLDDLELSDEKSLEAVVEVSRYLSTIRDVDELLERVLESVVRVMSAERGVLLSEEDGALKAVAARGLPLEDAAPDQHEISLGVVEEARTSGEPVLSGNALSDARFMDRASVMATDIRSVLCSPIRTKDRVFGFVYLDRRATDAPFDLEHQDLLAAFCTQIAVAWENAVAFETIEGLNAGLEQKVKERTLELRGTNEKLQQSLDELTNTRLKLAEAERDALEKEMALARDIQQTILPPEEPIERPGARLFGRVIPASYCGGDFWGWGELSDDRTLLLVADVTGHGVAASLITAVARSCLDTLDESAGEADVDEVLRVMNEVIHRSANGRLCATAFACIVDPAARKLRFSNAGHNFPYLVDEAGKAAPLIARGTRLGEARDTRFEAHEVEYQAGQRLVLFTDGIVEWANPRGKEYGDRRLLKSLAAHRAARDGPLLQALIEDAERFAKGVERDDDLTLLVADLVA